MHALYTGFYESIANLHGHAGFDYSLYGLQYPADSQGILSTSASLWEGSGLATA